VKKPSQFERSTRMDELFQCGRAATRSNTLPSFSHIAHNQIYVPILRGRRSLIEIVISTIWTAEARKNSEYHSRAYWAWYWTWL